MDRGVWWDVVYGSQRVRHNWVTNAFIPSSRAITMVLPSVFRSSSPSSPVAATAKSLQSCPTLCDPIDGSPPGSPVPGILQARTLEWGAIAFSSAWKWKVKVKSLSHVWLLATPWTAAHQAPPSMGFSRQEYWSGVPFSTITTSPTTFSHLHHWRPSLFIWLSCVCPCLPTVILSEARMAFKNVGQVTPLLCTSPPGSLYLTQKKKHPHPFPWVMGLTLWPTQPCISYLLSSLCLALCSSHTSSLAVF